MVVGGSMDLSERSRRMLQRYSHNDLIREVNRGVDQIVGGDDVVMSIGPLKSCSMQGTVHLERRNRVKNW